MDDDTERALINYLAEWKRYEQEAMGRGASTSGSGIITNIEKIEQMLDPK
ncbi:MAG: hypothetical protein UY60_C0002G0053 [Parcubacteria group bacterium GW2011_GWB1_50_9]|uniref:Uncharacterized protein n=1 Tax=Candidatus Kaiserbacteria bacterium GW2011_GWC2_52_8b TaxID=1618676 RepID=A0A0G2AGW2_9BACT|nr:MAG: hypothetical protein UY60_C0002G0053 [Parcubacteria group bacterium GW2011_GWB1_50_9]KKW24972.1 MAG: hypothetical protein VE99_C0004G0009 [candidate division Kazan bacterium GW2011_GWC1_52_13]KKW31784.1 MAG: hypothetical protein UY74_C0007G0013 [Candidatus Kaiserbacteria bacterium GW2011_GWC2_52_8b]